VRFWAAIVFWLVTGLACAAALGQSAASVGHLEAQIHRMHAMVIRLVITGAVTNTYSPIRSATQNQQYSIGMHELGHAMGLGHNPTYSSVMYPYYDEPPSSGFVPFQCYSYSSSYGQSTLPIMADTDKLENEYDPLAFKCEVTTASSARASQGNFSKLSGYSKQARQLAYDNVLAKSKWVHAEDQLHARSLSLDSLAIATPLIVRGQVVKKVATFGTGVVLWDVFQVNVLTNLRDDLHAAASGSVLVADARPSEGTEYSDDPILKPQEQLLLFLRPAGGDMFATMSSQVLVPEADFVSKWVITAQGTYSLPSESLVGQAVNGGTPSEKVLGREEASLNPESVRRIASAHLSNAFPTPPSFLLPQDDAAHKALLNLKLVSAFDRANPGGVSQTLSTFVNR